MASTSGGVKVVAKAVAGRRLLRRCCGPAASKTAQTRRSATSTAFNAHYNPVEELDSVASNTKTVSRVPHLAAAERSDRV